MKKEVPVKRKRRNMRVPRGFVHFPQSSFDSCNFALQAFESSGFPFPYRISDPKGISANWANLKHCFPKGIPIIVIQKRMPFRNATIANSSPPNKIQRILSKTEAVFPWYSISFPNGKKDNRAILKHCNPTGIPTMVIHHKTPTRSQDRPCHNPPKINQIIFPKILIILFLSIFCV